MSGEQSEVRLGGETNQPQEFKELVKIFAGWTEKPWNNDEGIAAFSSAFLECLPPNIEDIFAHGIEEIGEYADEKGVLPSDLQFVQMVANYAADEQWFIDSQMNANTSYKGRKLYHAARYIIFMMKNRELMKAYFTQHGKKVPKLKFKYPDDYDKPEAFLNLIRVIMENPELGDLMTWALETFRIRTTVIPRYLIPRRELRREFGDRPIRIGSVGVGSGHGEKALLANIVFDDVEIISPDYEPLAEPSVDPEATQRVNREKSGPLNIEELYAFDIFERDDEPQRIWMEASLLLREHKDRKTMKKYRKLNWLDDERYKQSPLDFTDTAAVDEFLERYRLEHDGQDPELDAFFAITMIYQLKTQEERDVAYENMAKFVKKDGFIIIQDSLDGSFEGDFNYVTIKNYPHHPEIPPKVIAESRDDRCQQIIIRND